MKQCVNPACDYLLETGARCLFDDHVEACPDCRRPLGPVPDEGDGDGDDAGGDTGDGEPVDDGGIVTVAAGLSPLAAELLRGRLAAEGIGATVQDAFFAGLDPVRGMAAGGARVRVRAADEARARAVVVDVDRPDAAPAGACPRCGGPLQPWSAEGLASAAAAVGAFLAFGQGLPARRAPFCPACDRDRDGGRDRDGDRPGRP